MYELQDPFSVCWNMLKMRYKTYDETLSLSKFLKPTDKVNIFISVESVLQYLSQIKDIDDKIMIEGEKEFVDIFVVNTLNLAAHYKRFFREVKLDTKVYLYLTDPFSDLFSLSKYNEDFRSFYVMKYTTNPKFERIGKLLRDRILPEIQTISEFIPNVYLIVTKNIEGSIVPYVIGQTDISRKNLIIGTDIYETQYPFFDADRFNYHCIRRNLKGLKILYTKDMILNYIFDKELTTEEKQIFENSSFFNTLLSCMGNKLRYIEPLAGIGSATVLKYFKEQLFQKSCSVIAQTTEENELIKQLFPKELQEQFENNYCCTSLRYQFEIMTTTEKMSITEHLKDRSDLNSLIYLNASRFKNNQLMLEELTM